jgi:hypothetical protein
MTNFKLTIKPPTNEKNQRSNNRNLGADSEL